MLRFVSIVVPRCGLPWTPRLGRDDLWVWLVALCVAGTSLLLVAAFVLGQA